MKTEAQPICMAGLQSTLRHRLFPLPALEVRIGVSRDEGQQRQVLGEWTIPVEREPWPQEANIGVAEDVIGKPVGADAGLVQQQDAGSPLRFKALRH